MTTASAIIGPSGGRDALMARQLYPNFFKTRAGDPPERGATRKDLRANMMDRKSILYPIPYLESEASRATWTQRATRGVPHLSTFSLAHAEPGGDIERDEIRETVASLVEVQPSGAQPLSVVYKRHDLEPLPPSISFRPHHNLADPVYYDMPPSPPYPAPPLLLKEQRRQKSLWSPLCNAESPEKRPHSIVFNPGCSFLSVTRGCRRGRRSNSAASEVSFQEVMGEPYPDLVQAESLQSRHRGREAAQLLSSRLGSHDEPQTNRHFPSPERRRKRAGATLGILPSRSVSVSAGSHRGRCRSSYPEESVPIPMPFWGRYDWYPPMKAPRQRIQAFGRPASRECVPLYESGLDDWTTFPWNETLRTTGHRSLTSEDRSPSTRFSPHRGSLRATGDNADLEWRMDRSTNFGELQSRIADASRGQQKFYRRQKASLWGALHPATQRVVGTFPRTECSFVCKEHRGRHVHLMDVFGPVERNRLSSYFDQDEADEIHRRARGCLGVHTASCPHSHNTLRKVLSDCAERGKPSDLDAFPQQTREPKRHWWSPAEPLADYADEKS
ncbi:Bax inhibitor 1, related protein, partial [Toxoplasma gondii p89]